MILTVDRVTKRFGKTEAVKHISLAIDRGRIYGLLGPNGAGKTTLIRMIMDILLPDEGEIRLGDDINGSTRKEAIGYLPEERGLYTKAKVRDTLLYFAYLKGMSKAAAQENCDYFLELMEMTQTANMKIGKLSKGNQQKIQLIASLISLPTLVILDEPFSGLDPVNVQLVSRIMTELKNRGVTILLSTHQLSAAETFCDSIFLFNKGELILEGELEPIITRYSGRYLLVEGDELPESDLFSVADRSEQTTKLILAEGVVLRDLFEWFSRQTVAVHSVKPFRLPLADIFIQEVTNHE